VSGAARSRQALALAVGVLGFACARSETPTAPSETAAQRDVVQMVNGRIFGHDGEPLSAAHVTVTRSNFLVPIFDSELQTDGGFRIELPGPGVYLLRLAGVDHAEAKLTVAVDGELAIDARLGTYARAFAPERLPVRLRWIDGEGNAGEASELEAIAVAGSEQHYALSLKSPADARAVQYQVVDPATGRSFNGPGGVRWIYDGGGDFWAERVWDGGETLELDLTSFPPSGVAPVLDVKGERLVVSRQSEAWVVLDPYRRRIQEVFGAKLEAAQTHVKLRAIALEARTTLEGLDDLELRVAVALEWAWFFNQFGPDVLTAEELGDVLARVSPEDPAWAFVFATVNKIFGPFSDDEALRGYRRRLAAAQNDPGLLAQLLHHDLVEASERGDLKAAREIYAVLVQDFDGTAPALWARSRLDPDRPLQIGRAMPRWQFAGLDGEQITSAQLHGRPYLLTVWATWCAPCVAEMESLHAVHEALGGQRGPIAFVSLSMDNEVTEVEAFRSEKWPMPWLNGHVPASEHKALYEAWKFVGIPLVVLVDADGTIEQVDKGLHGDELLSTLESVGARTEE
jgi:thiol-disulfide isomerase/thioredoxin